MNPIYGNNNLIKKHTNIIPPEAMTGDDIHDLAVCCAIWTAGGLMTQHALESVADEIREKHPNYPVEVAKTCRKIADEKLGYIYFVDNDKFRRSKNEVLSS